MGAVSVQDSFHDSLVRDRCANGKCAHDRHFIVRWPLCGEDFDPGWPRSISKNMPRILPGDHRLCYPVMLRDTGRPWPERRSTPGRRTRGIRRTRAARCSGRRGDCIRERRVALGNHARAPEGIRPSVTPAPGKGKIGGRSRGVVTGPPLPAKITRGQAAGVTDAVGVADAETHTNPSRADYRTLSVKFGSTFSVNSSQWRIILGSGINWV